MAADIPPAAKDAFISAVSSRDTVTAKQLISNYPGIIHARKKVGDVTALQIACLSRCGDMVQLLVENGAAIDGCTFYHACYVYSKSNSSPAKSRASAILMLLLSNIKTPLRNIKKDERNLFHMAAWCGNEQFLEKLNSMDTSGGMADATTSRGESPLRLAVSNGHANVIGSLTKNSNVSPEVFINDACPQTGDTALHVATRNKTAECIPELLTRGGNVHAKNKRGESPLDLITKIMENDRVQEDTVKIVVELLGRGATPSEKLRDELNKIQNMTISMIDISLKPDGAEALSRSLPFFENLTSVTLAGLSWDDWPDESQPMRDSQPVCAVLRALKSDPRVLSKIRKWNFVGFDFVNTGPLQDIILSRSESLDSVSLVEVNENLCSTIIENLPGNIHALDVENASPKMVKLIGDSQHGLQEVSLTLEDNEGGIIDCSKDTMLRIFRQMRSWNTRSHKVRLKIVSQYVDEIVANGLRLLLGPERGCKKLEELVLEADRSSDFNNRSIELIAQGLETSQSLKRFEITTPCDNTLNIHPLMDALVANTGIESVTLHLDQTSIATLNANATHKKLSDLALPTRQLKYLDISLWGAAQSELDVYCLLQTMKDNKCLEHFSLGGLSCNTALRPSQFIPKLLEVLNETTSLKSISVHWTSCYYGLTQEEKKQVKDAILAGMRANKGGSIRKAKFLPFSGDDDEFQMELETILAQHMIRHKHIDAVAEADDPLEVFVQVEREVKIFAGTNIDMLELCQVSLINEFLITFLGHYGVIAREGAAPANPPMLALNDIAPAGIQIQVNPTDEDEALPTFGVSATLPRPTANLQRRSNAEASSFASSSTDMIASGNSSEEDSDQQVRKRPADVSSDSSDDQDGPGSAATMQSRPAKKPRSGSLKRQGQSNNNASQSD